MSKKLFGLIRSLSPREKGYFKNTSFKHTLDNQNVYLSLFDVIDSMEEYDALRLQAAFKKKKPLKEIAAYSNYLFTNILDALKIYHARKTVDSELRQMLLDIELLYKKKLFGEARRIIVKAKKRATVYESFSLLLELINWEEKIATILYDPQLLNTFMHTSHFVRLEIADKLITSIHYNGLLSRINILSWQITEKVERNMLEGIMKHPLMRDERKAISLADKNVFYFIHSLYNFIKPKRDIKKSSKYIRKQKELMENNIEWASQAIYGYLGILNNLMITCFQAFDLRELDHVTLDLKKMPERFGNKINERDENMRQVQILDAYFMRCILSAEFEKGLAKIRGKEAEWESIYVKIGKRTVLFFYGHILLMFFATGDFKKALLWNNKILNGKGNDVYPSIYNSALMWNIIIHFNMGNLELAGSLFSSFLRLFQNKKEISKFEQLFLNNMQEIIHAKNDSETLLRRAFSVFRKELIELKGLSGKLLEQNIIFFIAWADSHIDKKKFSEAFKKYLNHRHNLANS